MTRTSKVLGAVLAFVALAVIAFMLVLSHDSPCGPAPVLAGKATMKAIVYRCYGSPEVLRLEDVVKPVPEDDAVLVKVRAASVNPLDWHYMRGKPYVMRLGAGIGAPTDPRMGVDFAGTVDAVGRNVERFKPGDEVFGGRSGAFGEYVTVREMRSIVLKPANVSFEQAAAVPVAAVTALQALRDKGKLRAGQKVLVNGASGGVGTFAVQIAKAMGANVTGVCSTRNVGMVRSIGADHVVDYTRENFTKGGVKYDLIIDNVGTHSPRDYRRVMTSDGILVAVGSLDHGDFIGPLWALARQFLFSPFVSQTFTSMFAELNQEDLEYLAGLMRAGKLVPVVDRSYGLSEVPQAIGYLEEGHARGKVVIQMP